VRMRHLQARPAVSATHLPSEELAVTVHGRAQLFELSDPAHGDLRQAMLDWYLPRQGPEFEEWLNREAGIGARIEPDKIFTFSPRRAGQRPMTPLPCKAWRHRTWRPECAPSARRSRR